MLSMKRVRCLIYENTNCSGPQQREKDRLILIEIVHRPPTDREFLSIPVRILKAWRWTLKNFLEGI